MSKTGYRNVNYFQNIGKSSEWYILTVCRKKNRYYKSFPTLEECLIARDKTYAMFGELDDK
jgi:hypothetical protein